MDKKLILKTKQISIIYDVSVKTVSTDWLKAGCPKHGRDQWYLPDVHKWWWDNNAADKALADASDESLNEAKRLFWWARQEREKVELAVRKSELTTLADVETGWTWRMAEYKSGCEGLENSLPPLLEGKSQPEMRAIIKKFVWSMFDRLCREGSFVPAEKTEKRPYKKRATKKKPGKKKADA